MLQQEQKMSHQVAVYLNPVAERRVHFQSLFGEQFARLFLADGLEQARVLLAQQEVGLLVIDLARFERGFDGEALGQLIGQRAGAPTLLLCPFESAGWLPLLMSFGPITYAISPLADEHLLRQVQAGDAMAAPPDEERLRALLATDARLQHAVAHEDDLANMAERLCAAIACLPGVMHASLFHAREGGELQLEAQHSTTGLSLARVLYRTDRLMHSPLRHAFPGLLAACTGEMALLDAPAKCGEPELAVALVDCGVEMVLAVPLPVGRSGAQRGSLCLMFDKARQFSAVELSAFGGFAQLAGVALRVADLSRENEQLAGRLVHMSSSDALTGVANRRHGEYLLSLEVRRARRYHVPLALIAFDVDRFKAINDQYGHPVGDGAIRAVAEAAQAALRNSDVLVRSGGDQFQIIAPHTSAIDALKVAEKIRLAIAATDIPGCDRVTVSLGVGQVSEQETPDALVVRVDAALARAKRAGRNCVELAMS
ncbi:diguanylate cyclase [Massilia sp. TSP1-1-2]|uniref:GGDEF domain-containing protein n=1 Tax=Massilia sp. TSP1-1-2 TaxID=2804649 RepID=UPI003CE95F71